MSGRRSPVGDYLRARRALVQPEDVGIPREPGRRVEGLRREEVARLAGISPEYYLRLEQGRDHQPSDQVVQALARALQLEPSRPTTCGDSR
jgi:transcriptional regulator with XRE-family HTH domain